MGIVVNRPSWPCCSSGINSGGTIRRWRHYWRTGTLDVERVTTAACTALIIWKHRPQLTLSLTGLWITFVDSLTGANRVATTTLLKQINVNDES